MADARDLKSLGEDPYRFESGHKHQRFKLGLKRSENGSLAQVPLPFFGSPYAIAFRSVYVTGERNRGHPTAQAMQIAPSCNRVLSRKSILYFERIASVIVPYRQSLFRTLTRLVAFATSRTLSAFAIPSFGNELPLSLRFTLHFVRELYSLLTVAACGNFREVVAGALSTTSILQRSPGR